ncbi:hypothetical protein JTB14_018836 [Gonioctena quinquepunctata]|nr:hypothetical protein JTB14_018836 [Gonioctena quinquepunctata]
MAVENTAKGFSKYCELDMNNKVEPIIGSIDEMLARLEEFQTMISFVVQDRTDYNDILSSIPNYGSEFGDMCNKIDTLEKMVAHIKSNLDHLESEIEKAENELGCNEATSKVTNIFTPLFKKNVEKKYSKDHHSGYFKTEEYFE